MLSAIFRTTSEGSSLSISPLSGSIIFTITRPESPCTLKSNFLLFTSKCVCSIPVASSKFCSNSSSQGELEGFLSVSVVLIGDFNSDSGSIIADNEGSLVVSTGATYKFVILLSAVLIVDIITSEDKKAPL
ncbi:protein of unknown function [Moritella yayanosii]|uniref:Uncharacterized protein n=1 Tax=Moritella yayanosii TaxID=69539 RepID=A0A330LXQ5_9GAMM|nr:protein of unknown function [Moritella yayanosii]